MKNPIELLRRTAQLEGVSFLVLLGIAMPLKYIWDQPMAVRIVGMLHGILFVAFCGALIYAAKAARWPLARAGMVFIAALIPFGPWLIDRRMSEYAKDYR